MRILKILNSSDKGGVFAYEVQFIEEFKRRNIQVDAVILGEEHQAKEYQKLCDITYTIPYLDAQFAGSPFNILNSILKSYKYGAKYSDYISRQIQRDSNYDAIIYCRPNMMHLAGLLSKHFNCRSLWHLPNTINKKAAKSYYNLFCDKYKIISIGNSVYTKNTLGDQCKHFVYMGYDENRVKASEVNFRTELSIKDEAPVYGVAARMHKDKAQDIVVEAFVKSDIPREGGHLLVAGGPLDSEFSREVYKAAKDLAGKQVHFLGEINDLPKFYSSVDVVINGRRNVEPFGISVAEALGAGKPVIAYYLGGPSEMIEHEKNGWLVKAPTIEAFEIAYNTSLQRRDKWVKMGAYAKSCASNYGVESNVDRLLEIINTNRQLA
jgi:glycosyltransferase involved in cell wall biosynthesis